jgi:hypothetical protein
VRLFTHNKTVILYMIIIFPAKIKLQISSRLSASGQLNLFFWFESYVNIIITKMNASEDIDRLKRTTKQLPKNKKFKK